MKLKIAVNKNCKNKSNPQVASGFLNIFEDIEWLQGWVQAGYAWCATHFADRHRNSENSRGSNLVVIDIDGDFTLQQFWATDTAKNWCKATYTSASHTESEHRFRALFPLATSLDTKAQHKGAYWLVVDRLVAEVGVDTLKDNCGQKPERLWYGNTNAEFIYNATSDVCVPEFLLEDISYEEPENYIHSEITQLDLNRCSWLLRNFLEPTNDGEYEDRYVPVMAACAGIGDVIFDDWVSWVLKGHHGQKDENIRRFKWNGLGNYAGHTTLYSLAKKQDSSWTNQLPDELRFNNQLTAVGYGDNDPIPNFDSLIDNLQMTSQNIPEESPEPLPDTQVTAKRKGRPKKRADDAAKEREQDVEKVKELLPNLRKNLLTHAIEYTDSRGNEIELQGNDLDLMTVKLSCEHGVFIPEMRVKAAVQYAAGINRYCPIQRYLNQCAEHAIPHAEWDNIGEIFLGNSNRLATLAMQRMMIGAVARAMNPGCSMSWLPILVGAQGIGKSMFSRNLVPEKLFSEVSTPLETLMKEQYRLHVGWLLELPEIDHFFNHTRNIENFKNLITTRVDEVRRPYATLPESLPRRFVMIGTTNRNQFLVDSTGNRRFVPLEIGSGFIIPFERLKLERDLLWASAVQAYRAGTPYEFSSGEIAQISEYIQEFGDPDPWTDKILSFIADREEVTASQVLVYALDLDPRQQGRKESRRVADVLQTVGWRREVTRRKIQGNETGKSIRIWKRPADDPIQENHILKDF